MKKVFVMMVTMISMLPAAALADGVCTVKAVKSCGQLCMPIPRKETVAKYNAPSLTECFGAAQEALNNADAYLDPAIREKVSRVEFSFDSAEGSFEGAVRQRN